MIPLHDNIPTRRFPAVTVLLILTNVAAYILDYLTQQQVVVAHGIDRFGRQVDFVDMVGGLSAHYSLIPAHVHNDLAQYWPTIFTSMFLHGGFMHIAGNMLYLWIFGNNVEDTLGKVRFLLFYFACGTIGAFAHVAAAPDSMIPTVGASGAIAGLMGAYLVLFPRAEITTIVPIFFIGAVMEVPATIIIGFWAVLQFANAYWLNGGGMQGGGVAYMAHVGGFLAGVLLVLLLGGRRLVEQRREERYGYDEFYNR
jgi:membrane associated rhomboid family serine protease